MSHRALAVRAVPRRGIAEASPVRPVPSPRMAEDSLNADAAGRGRSRTQDGGSWTQDAGSWTQDAAGRGRSRTQDAGFWTQDAGSWTQDAAGRGRSRTQDAGSWTQDAAPWTQDAAGRGRSRRRCLQSVFVFACLRLRLSSAMLAWELLLEPRATCIRTELHGTSSWTPSLLVNPFLTWHAPPPSKIRITSSQSIQNRPSLSS